MYFQYLRKTEWHPEFKWVETAEEAADYINRPHEDYPQRVPKTLVALEVASSMLGCEGLNLTTNEVLTTLHKEIFFDKSFAGRFRDVNVTVGSHRPPQYRDVAALMNQLQEHYKEIPDLATILEWSWDFLTIHPFQDGNGRVSGVVVGAFSHLFEPGSGWLAPLQ